MVKISEYYWTVSDYLFYHFGLKIEETMICETCHQHKAPKILEDNYFILLFVKISLHKNGHPFVMIK